jgi:hypothetical protein
MRDLFPEVEKVSQQKASLFTVRDTKNKTFNIAIVEDNASEIKIKYENISSSDKVKFHKLTNDLLHYDYLSLNLKKFKDDNLSCKIRRSTKIGKSSQQSLANSN